mgnify:CR=1 FL=1
MNSFLIVSNKIKDTDLIVAREIADKLKQLGRDVSVDVAELTENYMDKLSGKQCIIVLGGDGTMLKVSEDTKDSMIPLIGINMGTVGFLAEVEMTNLEAALISLIENRFKIEERMRLSGSVYVKGQCVKSADALNDVVLSRHGDLQIIGYRVFVNGMYLTDYHADGVIVSTPTGSTGYNMSAGGSIVEPSAQLVVLTPVCPHSMAARSVLLSATDKVEVVILKAQGERNLSAGVYFDGGKSVILGENDKVVISRSALVTRLIRLSELSFLEVLHKKMNES